MKTKISLLLGIICITIAVYFAIAKQDIRPQYISKTDTDSIDPGTIKNDRIGNEIPTAPSTSNASDKTDNEYGLLNCITDTIYKTDTELILLLDTLYSHTISDNFNKSIKKELEWMTIYQNRLCEYYDRKHIGSNTLTDTEKTDTVLNIAKRILETDEFNYTTLGAVLYNGITHTWLIFKQYQALAQLLNTIGNERQRKLLIKEYEEWTKLKNSFMSFCANIVSLAYWNGTIQNAKTSAIDNDISEVRIEMYRKEITRFHKSGTNCPNDTKVSIPDTVQSFLNYCNTTILKYNIPDVDDHSYYKLYDDATESIENLEPVLNKWIKARDTLSEELSDNHSYKCYRKNTSETLLKMKEIIESIEEP